MMEPNDDIYYYKDKAYKIFQVSKMKIGGTWIDVVIYVCQYENKDGGIWVREREEFFNLFKLAE